MFVTGETLYDQVLSLDNNNNPVTATTFTTYTYLNGYLYSGVSISVALSDPNTGMFVGSWSANTVGFFQTYYKNNVTDVIYVSDTYEVDNGSATDQTIYVGF